MSADSTDENDKTDIALPPWVRLTRDDTGTLVFSMGAPELAAGTISAAKFEDESQEDRALREAKRNEAHLRSSVEELLVTTELDVEWTDVVGNEDARQALIEAIEYPIQHAETYAFYNKKPGKGVLLSGPPGNGKTMLGRAAASVLAKLHGKKKGEASLLLVNGPSIQTMWVGQTEQKIRQIFAYAKAYQALHKHPLVVFIDECDAILPCRGGGAGRPSTNWEESNVVTFLAEMDGIEGSGAFIILATNRPESIDPALLRPGRCDRRITVKRPSRSDAAKIMAMNLRGVPVSGPDTTESIVKAAIEELYRPDHKLLRILHGNGKDYLFLSDTVSGAMCVGLVERAKNIAFRRDVASGAKPTGLSKADFIAAVQELATESIGLPDQYALQEFCERTGIREIALERIGAEKHIHAPQSKVLN